MCSGVGVGRGRRSLISHLSQYFIVLDVGLAGLLVGWFVDGLIDWLIGWLAG